ncbi:MAG: hypothetical protein WB441_13240 [Nocardioidaceae bacterium]
MTSGPTIDDTHGLPPSATAPSPAPMILAALSALPALGLLLLAGWLTLATASDTSDGSMVGVGYVVAAIVAAPALLALLLSAASLSLRRRAATAAVVLGASGFAVVLLALLFVAMSAVAMAM